MPRTNFVWGFFRGVILISEQDYMNLAFEVAEKGKYQTWTNPLVGAVIVKNNVVLAKGYHHQFGAAHAFDAAHASQHRADGFFSLVAGDTDGCGDARPPLSPPAGCAPPRSGG